MSIRVTDNKKISEIQNELSFFFPYLKIELLSLHNGNYSLFEKKKLIDCAKTIGEVRSIYRSGGVIIEPYMSISDLEKIFREVYGLSIHVYRKSGSAWLRSTTTDAWSLYEQNRQGEMLSSLSSG